MGRRLGFDTFLGLTLAVLVGAVTGGLFAAATEFFLVRRLYKRHIEQVLVTVGLSLASVALFEGIWGSDTRIIADRGWMLNTTELLGARIPNVTFLVIGVAVIVLLALVLFLKKTRYGLIIRAGVENRSMVTALGIDVRRAFTLMFTIGGVVAGIGGVMASQYFGYVSPHLGGTLLIFAFIVTVIGGLGSLWGAAVASMVVAVLQQFLNFEYGVGDFVVVLLLAVVLLIRPQGLFGKKAI